MMAAEAQRIVADTQSVAGIPTHIETLPICIVSDSRVRHDQSEQREARQTQDFHNASPLRRRCRRHRTDTLS